MDSHQETKYCTQIRYRYFKMLVKYSHKVLFYSPPPEWVHTQANYLSGGAATSGVSWEGGDVQIKTSRMCVNKRERKKTNKEIPFGSEAKIADILK